MTQLLCNGVRLDLPQGQSVQFTHDNPLFAFDKLSCERTTEFKLPATPINDSVLSLARIPAYVGTGMRTRFTAQLQIGAIVKDGYLYISEWTGSEYSGIFITGELVGLQAIKEAGKLSEIMDYSEYITAGQETIYAANDSALDSLLFAYMNYMRGSDISLQPSINIGLLIDKICTHLGVSCSTPSEAYKMRLAPNELLLPDGGTAYIHSVRTEGTPYNTIYPDELLRIIIEERDLVGTDYVTYHNGYNNLQGDVLYTDTSTKTIAHFRTLNNIVLTFSDDLSDDYFLLRINDNMTTGATFYGDYSFTKTILAMNNIQTQITGTPLAGRSVEIPAGTSFILANINDYVVTTENTIVQIDDEPVTATAVSRGWQFESGLSYEIEVEIEPQESEPQDGDIVRLQDNLPDITFIDLLKQIAIELGYVLNYTEAGGIIFEDLDYSTWDEKEIEQLLKRGNVQRTFADYGQRNIIHFNDDGIADKTQQVYTISNVNLAESVELMQISWTNGNKYGNKYATSAGVCAYDNIERDCFLEIRGGDSTYGIRATIAANTGLQALCTASTQFEIEVRMTAMEYNAITAKTLLLVEGTLYVWTARSWQDNTAKFTLAKV